MRRIPSTVSNAAIRWLSTPSASPLAQSADRDLLRQAIPALNGADYGNVEILRLNLGLSVAWSAHRLPQNQDRRLTPFAHFSANAAESVLIVHSVHAGRTIFVERYSRKELRLESGEALFGYAEDVDFTLLLEDCADFEATTFIVSRSALSNILGEDIAGTFLAAAGLSESPSARVLPIPPHISGMLQSALPDGLDEALLKLFAQARALEYLCMLAAHVTGEASFPGASLRERQMQQLYEELLAIDGKLPPLFELAERYGMSVKTLNENFKRMFGQTIGAFTAAQRLNEAHAALQETDIPMKVLAARTGYSHVNNFINAFTHRFGYSPGSLRKSGAIASTEHARGLRHSM